MKTNRMGVAPSSGVSTNASHIKSPKKSPKNRQDIKILPQEHEARFRNIFDHSSIGMALVNPDGSWLQVNQAVCDIVGYSKSELLDLTFQDITHPDDLALDLSYVQQILAGERYTYQIEKRYLHKRGHVVWVNLSVALMRDLSGQPLYFISQIQDISQYKVTQSALKASQAELQMLFEAMTDVVIVRDVYGRCLKILPSSSDKLYQPIHKMLGKTVHETLPPAAADLVFRGIQQALKKQQPIQGEYSLEIHGKTTHLSANFAPLPSDQVMIVAHDITAHKKVENNLKLQSLITQNMAEGVCLLRAADGIMVYTNPKFERIFGYEPGELIGQHVAILNYADEDDSSEDIATRIIEKIHQYGEYTYEVHNIKKDGTPFWCRATTSVFDHPEHGTVYVAVQADITAEKQAQAEIRLLQTLALTIGQAEDFTAALASILQAISETYGWVYGEAWIPCPESNVLRCSPASYTSALGQTDSCNASPLTKFRRTSETFTFPANIGLPGRVWASQQPEWQIDVSKESEPIFLRQTVAAECGIKAGLGFPIVIDNTVLAVLIFFKFEANPINRHLITNLTAATTQLNLLLQRKQTEDELLREKELAQVTLQSIGDGVITVDARGHIQYLNPVAQKLTGWGQSEVQGLPITKVLHLVNATTGDPITNPVEEALALECVIGLEPDTVLIHRDGYEIAIDNSCAPIRNRDNQVIGVVMVFQDVSESRTLAQKLTWQATHDSLTQLINRHEFEKRLALAISEAKLQNQSHVLGYLDLDRFKIVNDTCGHSAGDELLRQVTSCLQTKIRKTDMLARLGGDEFGLLLYKCTLEQCFRVVRTLQQQVENFRFVWNGKSFSIGVSIGIVEVNADCHDSHSVLSQADAACYESKRCGPNRMHVYDNGEELTQQKKQLQWVNRLNEALEKDQFCLYYQSITSVHDAEAKGEHYEVLLRLRDEAGRLVAPGVFIPAAERYKLMHLIDRWVIRTLFKTQGAYYQKVWKHAQSCGQCDYLYTINLSSASINDNRFIHFLREQFALHQIPPQLICFEITETVAISNLNKAIQFMENLKKLGCQFALDDFGSGMSSFGYLKKLPVDYVKIDGSFVKPMVNSPADAAIVAAINQVSQVIGLKTIAEFVEDKAILEKLKTLNVDYAQGYGVVRPRLLASVSAV